jgi:YD repeat-containing protein
MRRQSAIAYATITDFARLQIASRGYCSALAPAHVQPSSLRTTLSEEADDPGLFGEHSVGLRATSITNRRSNATSFTYDDDCFTATAPGGRDTEYCTDTPGRPETITNDQGTVTELDWNSDNYLTNYRLAAGTADEAETVLTYNRLGDPETITDPNEHVTALSYRYGTEGGPTLDGADDGNAYVSDLQTLRRPNDSEATAPTIGYGLDSAGNVTSQTAGDNDPVEINYPSGSHGLPDYVLDELAHKTSYADYDANGNPRTVIDPRQNADELVDGVPYVGTWRYTYDAVGNLLAVTDPRGSVNAAGEPYTTSFDYDAFDRVVESLTPKCSTCSTPVFIERNSGYDANGNATSSTDGNRKTTTRTFTAMDALATKTSPAVSHDGEGSAAGELAAYDYDARENLTLATSPNGTATETAGDFATAFVYDALDRRVRMTRQSRGSTEVNLITSYAYDLRDNVVGIADPNANAAGGVPEDNASVDTKQRWAYGYDKADNRIDAVEDPDGLALHTHTTYDANDNVASEISPRGMAVTVPPTNAAEFTTTYAYDVRDDVTSITRGGQRTTVYGRYDDGKIRTITSPRGVATADPEDVADDHDYETSYEYDANGDIAKLTLPRAPGQVPTRAATIRYGRNAVGDPIDVKDPRGNDEDESP